MIYVLTVHWKDDRWIDVQLGYLQRFIGEPFKIFAFLNYIDRVHESKFDYVSCEPIASHAVKLNLLADIATVDSSDPEEDLLLFLDGDAFPVGDLGGFARRKLENCALVAVVRSENGDVQPHPCCCLTSIASWASIGGDWKSGYRWENAFGESVTDVGGNLLERLQTLNVPWHAMHRTKGLTKHPLFFALYDDLVYHHGAGFRDPFSRADLQASEEGLVSRAALCLPDLVGLWRVKRHFSRVAVAKRSVVSRNKEASEEVFERVVKNDCFSSMSEFCGAEGIE